MKNIPEDETTYLIADDDVTYTTIMLDLGVRFLHTSFINFDIIGSIGLALNNIEIERVHEKYIVTSTTQMVTPLSIIGRIFFYHKNFFYSI